MAMNRTRKCWHNMINRCSPKSPSRKYYFDKGISVCERWKTFENFKEDMGDVPEGLTIDRIDGSKGYFKENCRWATQSQQARNVSSNHKVFVFGENMTVTDLAERIGLKPNTVLFRIRRGWKMEEVVNNKRESNGRLSYKRIVPPMGRLWKNLDAIRADRESGMTTTEIARKYNYDAGNVSRFLKRNNIHGVCSRAVNTAKTHEQVREMRKRGMSLNKIAKELNKGISFVYYHVKQIQSQPDCNG